MNEKDDTFNVHKFIERTFLYDKRKIEFYTSYFVWHSVNNKFWKWKMNSISVITILSQNHLFIFFSKRKNKKCHKILDSQLNDFAIIVLDKYLLLFLILISENSIKLKLSPNLEMFEWPGAQMSSYRSYISWLHITHYSLLLIIHLYETNFEFESRIWFIVECLFDLLLIYNMNIKTILWTFILLTSLLLLSICVCHLNSSLPLLPFCWINSKKCIFDFMWEIRKKTQFFFCATKSIHNEWW